MKMLSIYGRYCTFMGMAVLLLAACRKDLCYDHEKHALSVKTDVAADWEQEWERTYRVDWKNNWKEEWSREYDELRPSKATGIRALVYQTDGRYVENNLNADGGRLPMEEGIQALLFYNNDTEYIVFGDLSSSVSASVTTRTLTRGNFQSLHANERTVNQPDQLYGSYIEEYEAQRTLESVSLPVTLRPLTYTYMIRFEFSAGLKYVALARGALAGMAESVYLQDGHTGAKTATVMFDCTLEDFGVEALVKTFGVPNYPGDHYTRVDGENRYTLNLEVRLSNGKIKNFEFDVTDQVASQPRGGVLIVNDVEISDEEGQEGSGAFDPTVEGWGDYIDIPLPII